MARGFAPGHRCVAGPVHQLTAVALVDQSVIVLTDGPAAVGPGIPVYFANRAGTTATLRAVGLAGALFGSTMTAAAAALTQPFTF